MALQLQIVCNGCGILLKGKHGQRYENKPHLFIKGRITLEGIGDTDKKWHMFLTKSDDEETTVCNTQCLKDYCDLRQKLYTEYRQRELRKEAGGFPSFQKTH